MLITEARAAAADWARQAGVKAAFVTGSSLDRDDTDELPSDSDLDVVAVVDGPPPAKIGKLDHHGVRLDVSFLAALELADADAVARTHYLAPSFAKPMIIVDDGRLQALVNTIAPTFSDPEMIRARVDHVIARMDAGLTGVGRPGTWAEQLQRWIFPISLPTQALLVAGRRPPTVRLRYLRARELLAPRGRLEVYADLLDLLGCRSVPPALVDDQLAALEAAFTAAVRCPRTALPFGGDIEESMRDAAVGATARLAAAGHPTEAVYWLMVTFLRCQLVLEEAQDPATRRTEDALRRAADELLGVRTAEDLVLRADRLAAWKPALQAEVVSLMMEP
jgi:hypothetical protein